MKMKQRFILAATLAAALTAQSLLADDQPGGAPAKPPEHPAKKSKNGSTKKAPAVAKKPAASSEPEKTSPLVPGPAVVSHKSLQTTVNVRGQPSMNSEVVARLKKGEPVTVLTIVTNKPKEGEPDKWAKIILPSNTVAWVNTSFVNAADKTVKPNKLNIRSGPGENYSVIGRIPKGTPVKEIETKGDWMKIEPPSDSYGFVAAHLLSSQPAAAAPPPMIVASVEPPKPAPAPAPTVTTVTPTAVPVAPTDPIVPPTAPPPTAPPPATPAPAPVTLPPPVIVPAPSTPPPDAGTAAPAPATPPEGTPAVSPPAEEILVKRIVSREGVVKRSASIQAPTYFALESLDTRKTINYLYCPTTNLVLKDFQGQRILVTGEEMLDERWPNTPVINVDSLQPVP